MNNKVVSSVEKKHYKGFLANNYEKVKYTEPDFKGLIRLDDYHRLVIRGMAQLDQHGGVSISLDAVFIESSLKPEKKKKWIPKWHKDGKKVWKVEKT